MVHTLKDMRDVVLRRLDEAGDTGTTKALANDLLNQSNQFRAMEYASAFLVWDIPCFFATQAGIQIYALHEEFMRPLYFFNRATKGYLKEVPERQLGPEGYRWNDATGSAEHFVLWGRTQVKRQPTSASILEITSSSALDTGGTAVLQVLVRGETANGTVKAEILNPNGTNLVTTVNSFTKIMQVSKAGSWEGSMTMYANDGDVVVLELDGCDLGKMYQQLYLLEAPTDSQEIEYRFYRNPIRMTNDYDQPDIPYPFGNLLIYDALLQIAGYNTELSAAAVSVWRDQQERLSVALANNMLEGQSLEARTRYIRPMDHTDWSERVRWD